MSYNQLDSTPFDSHSSINILPTGTSGPIPKPNDEPFADLQRRTKASRYVVFKGFANRMIHSRFYKAWYLLMTCTALFTLVLSFLQSCPTILFTVLEIFINIAMVLEVTVRVVALGRAFWRSWINLIDMVLLIMCIATVVFVLTWDCKRHQGRKGHLTERHGNEGSDEVHDGEEQKKEDEHAEEAIVDSLLLIFRNIIQLFRLLAMMKKNSFMMAHRARIDFGNLPPDGVQAPHPTQNGFAPLPSSTNPNAVHPYNAHEVDLWQDELLFAEDEDVFKPYWQNEGGAVVEEDALVGSVGTPGMMAGGPSERRSEAEVGIQIA